MNNKIYKRVLREVDYILNNNMTIREIAKIIKVSKSTVHKDLHERLFYIDETKHNKVDKVLKKHIETRHINGGNATKKKYEKIRKG